MKPCTLLFAAPLLFAACCNALAAEPKPKHELAHPDRVSIPDDIPFTTLVTGMLNKEDRAPRTARVFPAIDYQHGHYDGWQEALSTVRDHGIATAKKPDPIRFIIATNSPTLVRGMDAGYRACLDLCDRRLQRGESEEQLRRHCATAYAPTFPAPAPAPAPNAQRTASPALTNQPLPPSPSSASLAPSP